MKKKSLSSRDNTEQSQKFIQAAKELECDEDEVVFDAKLKKILEKESEKKG